MFLAQIPISPDKMTMLRSSGSTQVREFRTANNLKVLFSVDPGPHGELKHISVSHPERWPRWDELLEIKEALLGDIDAMMMMPRKADYVNLHPNCFHIWQTPQWGIG